MRQTRRCQWLACGVVLSGSLAGAVSAHGQCVDGTFTGQSDWGKPHAPFKTVGEANDVAWNGARIKIISGDYPEQTTFSKRLQLLSSGGLVRIGG